MTECDNCGDAVFFGSVWNKDKGIERVWVHDGTSNMLCTGTDTRGVPKLIDLAAYEAVEAGHG